MQQLMVNASDTFDFSVISCKCNFVDVRTCLQCIDNEYVFEFRFKNFYFLFFYF